MWRTSDVANSVLSFGLLAGVLVLESRYSIKK